MTTKNIKLIKNKAILFNNIDSFIAAEMKNTIPNLAVQSVVSLFVLV